MPHNDVLGKRKKEKRKRKKVTQTAGLNQQLEQKQRHR